MTSIRGVLIAGVAALAASLAAARPPTDRDVTRMALADVLGRTLVCPLQVVVDEDPLRLPRRIKFISCARAGARRSPAAGAAAASSEAAPDAACRRYSEYSGYSEYSARCVEVFDDAVVQYLPHAGAAPQDAARRVVQVPVGCACELYRPTTAVEDE